VALSHHTAARLLGLEAGTDGAVEVTRERGWRAPPGVVAHRGRLPAEETTEIDGLYVTSLSRTIFDLAGTLSVRRLERVMNEAEVLRLTDRVSIPELVARYPARRGTRNLRALLARAEPPDITRSQLEEAFVALIDRRGIPRPRLNAHLAVRGRFIEVDCLWSEQRLIAELDGRAVHGTGRAFDADRERDRILVADGWRVIRVTWRQIHEGPDEVVRDLRRLLEA
jgi:very-short-patch-repair endonuclease